MYHGVHEFRKLCFSVVSVSIVCGLVNKLLAPSADNSSIAFKVKKAIKDELVHRFHPASDEAS